MNNTTQGKANQKYADIEQLGYDEATEQFKTQGCFSSGRTWDDDAEANEAYDRGVNKAEASQKLPNWSEMSKEERAANVQAHYDKASKANIEQGATLDALISKHAQAGHSPLPWKVAVERPEKEQFEIWSTRRVGVAWRKVDAQLIVASVNNAAKLAEALRHSADKLNDLSEWLNAYAESKQALSVKAIENEARAALAAYELSEETLLRLAHRLDAEKRVHETRTTLEVAQRQFRSSKKQHAAKKKAQRK